MEIPTAPGAAAGCDAALYHIHEEVLGECWDERKRWADKMYRGTNDKCSKTAHCKLESICLRCPAPVAAKSAVDEPPAAMAC